MKQDALDDDAIHISSPSSHNASYINHIVAKVARTLPSPVEKLYEAGSGTLFLFAERQ
jgi:hypothetical protein